MTGDVFPSPNWCAATAGGRGWIVLQRGSPAFRVTKGGLENLLLRSPVKRWTPPFPVQPDPSAWDNGRHVHDVLLVPITTIDPAHCWRMALAWSMPPREARNIAAPRPLLDALASAPDGLVITSLGAAGNRWRLRVFEARGKAARWSLPRGLAAEKRDFAGRPSGETADKLAFAPCEACDVWLTQDD